MTTFPPLEARVSALERRQMNTDARIEEVTEKMTTSINNLTVDIKNLSDTIIVSFRHLTAYQVETERQIDTRFNQVGTRFDKVEARLDAMDTRFDKVEARLDKIETRLDGMDTRFNKIEATLDGHAQILNQHTQILTQHTELLTQILARLPEQKS